MPLRREMSLRAPEPVSEEITMSDDVTRRVDTLLRRMPRDEDAWNRHLWCRNVVINQLKPRLTLEGIQPTSSVPEIFNAYAQRVSDLSVRSTTHGVGSVGGGVEGGRSFSRPVGFEEDFIKVVAIATGEVLIRHYEATRMLETTEHDLLRRDVSDGIRNCFWKAGSSATMSEMTVRGYRGAVVYGLRLLMDLHGHLGLRVHELPFHVKYLSVCMLCRNRGAPQHIARKIATESCAPRQQWDSRDISVPNLVYDNLGGKLSRLRVHQFLKVPYSHRSTVPPIQAELSLYEFVD